MPAKNLNQVSIYLTPDHKASLEKAAQKEGRTLAAEIRLIIERELKRRGAGY